MDLSMLLMKTDTNTSGGSSLSHGYGKELEINTGTDCYIKFAF